MKLYYRFVNRINRFLADPVQIPSYEEKRATIGNYKNRFGITVLIETGTFMGETVDYFKSTFGQITSIELSEDLAKQAQEKFKNDKNVTIIQGDSGRVLPEIIGSESEPMLFWLDGHYSSEFMVGEVLIKTAKGITNTPIEAELRAILEGKFNHVILIDDARLFVGLNDYPTIQRIKRIVRKSKKKYDVVVSNDIIRITPRN